MIFNMFSLFYSMFPYVANHKPNDSYCIECKSDNMEPTIFSKET